MVVGCWLLVVDCWLLVVVGCLLLLVVVGCCVLLLYFRITTTLRTIRSHAATNHYHNNQAVSPPSRSLSFFTSKIFLTLQPTCVLSVLPSSMIG